jgi:glycerate kinase
LRATTFGVGQLILDASRRKAAAKIIVGLGGSATNDGGFGMARAIGFRFFLDDDTQVRSSVSKLATLKIIEKPRTLALPSIIAAADVCNPLLGENGATRIFGPQKGVGRAELDILERSLTRLAKVTAKEFGRDDRNQPGAGAAGGLGFGLMTFAGAIVRPGFDVVNETVGLEAKIRGADLVITGEGKLDSQTLDGKAPAGVARIARKIGKPVVAIVGSATGEKNVREMFDGVYELKTPQISLQESLTRAAELLRERAREFGKVFAKVQSA